MCGVLGLVHSKEDVVTESSSNSIIARGLESISLRGPDAKVYLNAPYLSLQYRCTYPSFYFRFI